MWIKEKDNNSKYFHHMKNSRRRHIHLGTLEVDGVVYEDSEVTNQVAQFYEKLYKETKA